MKWWFLRWNTTDTCDIFVQCCPQHLASTEWSRKRTNCLPATNRANWIRTFRLHLLCSEGPFTLEWKLLNLLYSLGVRWPRGFAPVWMTLSSNERCWRLHILTVNVLSSGATLVSSQLVVFVLESCIVSAHRENASTTPLSFAVVGLQRLCHLQPSGYSTVYGTV